MFLLTIVAETTEDNPDHGTIGEAYVNCWINVDDEAEAIEKAHAMIESDGWSIIDTEDVTIVTEDDFDEDDPYLSCFEQALTDGEVCLFHISPKYPVYRMVLKVRGTTDEHDAVEAIAWVCNEALETDYDPMEPDFWSGERITKAISLAADTIAENGYDVLEVIEQTPVGRDETSDEIQYYDDAEGDGICVILVHDEPE